MQFISARKQYKGNLQFAVDDITGEAIFLLLQCLIFPVQFRYQNIGKNSYKLNLYRLVSTPLKH